jgi:hypothetical protein
MLQKAHNLPARLAGAAGPTQSVETQPHGSHPCNRGWRALLVAETQALYRMASGANSCRGRRSPSPLLQESASTVWMIGYCHRHLVLLRGKSAIAERKSSQTTPGLHWRGKAQRGEWWCQDTKTRFSPGLVSIQAKLITLRSSSSLFVLQGERCGTRRAGRWRGGQGSFHRERHPAASSAAWRPTRIALEDRQHGFDCGHS